jgi:crotonobetaine/carnitine-CoA ligase
MFEMPAVNEITLRQRMDQRAIDEPDHVFCRFGDVPWTFGRIDALTNRVANGLLARGVRPGDRVMLMLPSHPDHIVAILALAKVGFVRVPVNVHLIGSALQFAVDSCDPQVLIVDEEYVETVRPFVEGRPIQVIVRSSRDCGDGDFAALLAHPDAAAPAVAPRADDVIAITPSSGTTGAPKGVLKSDRTLRAGPMAILALTEARPGDTFLFWEALHHGAGVAVVIAAVLEKLTLAMVDRFSASRFWQQARTSGVTHVHYLGGVLPILMKQPPSPEDRTHGVRIAWGGGCPQEVWAPFAERFGVTMREGYGLSELITFVCENVGGPVGSMGKPLSYYDVRLVDDAGADVPEGEPGEIVIRARHEGLQFLGYFRNEKATAEAWLGDHFRTGDLARRDAEGWLFFAGRKKDSLRRRGVNISAWEVERVVAEHPAIQECALIGVPSEIGDDELKLFVRLADGESLGEAALVAWSRERLPNFQVPRFVSFVDDFPRTPTQRIRKLELPRTTAGVWDAERQ